LGSALITSLFSTNDNSKTEGNETGKQQTMADVRADFMDKSKEMFQSMMNDQMADIKTIVYIPAGTRMIVFPNEDLWLRTFENDAEASSNLEKPKVLIDDKKMEEDAKKNQMASSGSGGNYDDVVYQEEGEKATPLIADDKKSKKGSNYGSSSNYIPPVTVDPVAPPPSYDGGNYGDDEKEDASDSGKPQLF